MRKANHPSSLGPSYSLNANLLMTRLYHDLEPLRMSGLSKLRSKYRRWAPHFNLQRACTHMHKRSGAKTFEILRLEIAQTHLKVPFWHSTESPCFCLACAQLLDSAHSLQGRHRVMTYLEVCRHSEGEKWAERAMHLQKMRPKEPLDIQRCLEIQSVKVRFFLAHAIINL